MAATDEGTAIIAALGSAKALAEIVLKIERNAGLRAFARTYLDQHEGARAAVKDLEGKTNG